jgi:hypothetical protein
MRSKDNTLLDLPPDDELNTLREYLAKRIPELCAALTKRLDVAVWRELANVTACRLIIFNARRGGEITTMLTSDFERRTSVKESDLFNMDETEKFLAKR